MIKKIIWEKWLDPFDDDDDQPEEENNKNEWRDSYEKAEDMARKAVTGPMLVGPMGIIPIKEGAKPGKLYNFWMMHTNFNITKSVKDTLKKMDGVEAVDIFTRYRARLAFGKVFEEEVVKNSIEQALLKIPEVKKDTALTDKLNQKYKFWALLELSNKQIKIIGNDTKEKVQQSIVEWPNAKIKQTSWSE